MSQDNEDTGRTDASFTGLPTGDFDYATYHAEKKKRRLRDRELCLMALGGLTVYIMIEVFITKGKLTAALRPSYVRPI